VDFFDDAVRMLESAAIGMAVAALRVHLDTHQTDDAAAGVTVLETMHAEGESWRADGVQAHPEWYALVDVQVTTLYARVHLLGQAGDDSAEQALTA
jgi:hypothetical protein